MAVVHCMRALAQHNQKTGNKRIPWGGTKEVDWLISKECVTFHFDHKEYRESFLQDAKRLLPQSLWSIVGQDDNDPAKKQRT